jgi:hypothetical protein
VSEFHASKPPHVQPNPGNTLKRKGWGFGRVCGGVSDAPLRCFRTPLGCMGVILEGGVRVWRLRRRMRQGSTLRSARPITVQVRLRRRGPRERKLGVGALEFAMG